MIIIKKAYQEIQKIIGIQEYNKHTSYRSSRYNINLYVKEGTLIYNVLLGALILIEDGKESEDVNCFLVNNWFYVPNDFEDIAFVKRIRISLIAKDIVDKTTTYTIFPTTKCNARCPYCFEKGRTGSNMTIETASNVSEYITTHSKGEKVLIRWFGGEPLLGTSSINTICKNLHDKGIDFVSKMATNGFLFNELLISNAKRLWNLKQVQITIDGTRDSYNKTKRYNTPIDAFSKIITNIHHLAKNKILVVIRLNIDETNIDDLLLLMRSCIIPEFQGNKYVMVYSHLLDKLIFNSKESIKDILSKKNLLDKEIYALGFSCNSTIPTSPKIYKCITDDKRSITILPNGKIGLCEHYTEDKFFSDITTPEIADKNIIKELREYHDDLLICKECPYYPRCIRLKCCPEDQVCNKFLMEYNIDRLKDMALSEYNYWKHKNIKLSKSVSE